MMKYRIKKGFTLIEMLVVVVIVGILLAIGMNLSWNSLEKLKAKAVTEEVTALFDTIFLQVNASRYEQSQPYSGISLILKEGSHEIQYIYHLEVEPSSDAEPFDTKKEQSGALYGKFTITALTGGESESLSGARILYVPFSPKCTISPFSDSSSSFPQSSTTEYNSLSFSLKPKGRDNACFRLDKEYCRLQAIPCKYE